MKNNYKAIIVGGGASGLMCAIDLLRDENCLLGQDILILEKNDRVGKKLLATGNGQANLSNVNLSANNYHGDKRLIDLFIQGLNKINLQEYLENLGIPLTTASDGKQYPLSKQANVVLDIFRQFLAYNNVNTLTNQTVVGIDKTKQGYLVKTEQNNFTCTNVVLAFGGSVGKQFGTDGSSYKLATNLGHEVTKLYPSLVQLKTNLNAIRGLKGLKEKVRVSAYDNGKLVKQSEGDLLFTDFGVSGNAIFEVSSYLTNAKNPSINVEFLHWLTQEQIEEIIDKRLSLKYLPKEEVLSCIINKRIGQAILKNCKEYSGKCIANLLKNFRLEITGNLGNNYAQVTKGGIQGKHIGDSYESTINEGLYVDGDCGGYNLTFAFISGILASKGIKNNIKNRKGNL